jgi:hypothetical protein
VAKHLLDNGFLAWHDRLEAGSSLPFIHERHYRATLLHLGDQLAASEQLFHCGGHLDIE